MTDNEALIARLTEQHSDLWRQVLAVLAESNKMLQTKDIMRKTGLSEDEVTLALTLLHANGFAKTTSETN